MKRVLPRWWPVLIVALCAAGMVPMAGNASFTPPSQATETWVNVTGNLANMESQCGNLTLLSAVPRSELVIAGVALKGLWVNRGGSTWSHLGDGPGSAQITNRPSWIVYDPLSPAIFWESGIYSGPGVFQTLDGGKTFQQRGAISHSDYVSVDFRDPSRRTLLAGGHEQAQTVNRSTDAGQSWTNIGLTLPANKFSSNPLIINSQIYLVNVQGNPGGTTGIYLTTNGGTSWRQVSTVGPSGPPLVASDGSIYWPSNDGLMKSTNSGVSWTIVGNNLQPIRPLELSNGRLIAVGSSHLMISADGGSTWSPVGPALPFAPSGVTFSERRRAFFIWRGDCGNVVPPDAIMMTS